MCGRTTMGFKWRYVYIIVALFGFTNRSVAQQFDPFNGKSSEYQVNLKRYFKSAEIELTYRVELLDSVKKFQSNRVWNLTGLAARLNQYEHFLVELERHSVYWTLKYYQNKKDTAALSNQNILGNCFAELKAYVNKAILQSGLASLTDRQLKALKLSRYKHLLLINKETAAHTPSVQDLKIINKIGDPVVDGLDDRYNLLMDQIKAKSVISSDGKIFDPITELADIKRNKDVKLRMDGAKSFLNAYDEHEEVFAATLIDIARQENAIAKLYGYSNAPARMYDHHLQLGEADVKDMLDELALHADILQNYQRVQIKQIEQSTGLHQTHSWDMSLPLGYVPEPQDFLTAKKNILQALSPLGADYTNHFAFLLDPTHGELDITGGPNRVTEYTSRGYPGIPTTLYMKSFNGDIVSIKTLIHEGGHAVHRQLMSDNYIVPTYSSGPNFLFESFAMFNELLLFDELKNKSSTNSAKAFYTKQFTDKLAFELFTSAEEGSFEQGIYDGVSNGKIHNMYDIDSLYAGIMNKYDLFFKNEPERHGEWINKRLLYDDPIYNVNYLYAILVTCKLYELVHLDPQNFSIRYSALLRNGFDASADDLLKKFMGFSLDRKDLIEGALRLMKQKTSELNELYQKQ
jgi:oligoendopeptidase F